MNRLSTKENIKVEASEVKRDVNRSTRRRPPGGRAPSLPLNLAMKPTPPGHGSEEDVEGGEFREGGPSPRVGLEGGITTPRPVAAQPGPAAAGDGAASLRGCERVTHAMKAGLVGLVSSGLGFGTKPWAEAIATASALSAGADPLTANLIAGMVGGLWIGGVHQATSNLTAALLNAQLGVQTYTPTVQSEFKKQLLEMLTVSLLVQGGFCATYSVRGALMETVDNVGAGIAAIAASKTLATMMGGLIQGFVTDLVRQVGTELKIFTAKMPTEAAERNKPIGERVRESMAALTSNMNGRKLGHDFMGKQVGGVVGNFIGLLLSPAEFGARTIMHGLDWGASGMGTFLCGWFGFIHAGALMGAAF